LRLIVSILLSPWSQTKTSIHQTSSVLCREATSDQARLYRLNLTTFKILDIGNTVISLVLQFLSCLIYNICYLINQYPYQYLVFIVIPFLARQWLCLGSYHHFYTSIDVFEAWWIKGSILPHLNFAVLATCYYDLILTSCGSINTKRKKLMDKLTSASGNIERMILVW